MTDEHAPATPDAAAGLKGVSVAMKVAIAEMGPVRAGRLLPFANKPGGFDCPGCAWPEADKPHAAEFCENGAKAIAWEATKKRVTSEFFADHAISDLQTRSDHWLESNGRLTQPMHRAAGDDHYRPISWESAIALAGRYLRELPDPKKAVFYTSGRTSNEAAFLYQLMVRRLGSNNLPDCSNMCHESSGVALGQTLGIGKGTVSLEDISEHAELIVVAGQNPGTNHPRMLVALEEAKRRGARIVAINPLPEAGLVRFKNPQKPSGIVGRGTVLSDLHLPIRLNGDMALFRLVNRRLLELGEIDEAFIRDHTSGFEAASRAWRDADAESDLAATGLERAAVEEFIDLVVSSKSIIVCWAMGLTQHRNSVGTISEIVNFLLLRGNVGRPGAGACPVRGHSNVQGDRTMGINERPPAAFLDSLKAEFGFEPPREHGYNVVESIMAMRDRDVEIFVGLGGNFAAAAPDSSVTAEALTQCRLTVHVATKLNRTHVIPGQESLLLPTLGRTERDLTGGRSQFVTVEDSMSRVHASRGRIAPASDSLRSEPWIVAQLARAALGTDDDIDWEGLGTDYARVRSHIARVVTGFKDMGRDDERGPEGFVLPVPPRERIFPTTDGKAHFTVNVPEAVAVPPGHLLLQTLRSHDQYNTTVYGLDDRYRGISGRRDVLFISAADREALGLARSAVVTVVSVAPDGERRLPDLTLVDYPTARGCVATYFPEANVLIPLDSYAVGSHTPTSKSVVVRLEVLEDADALVSRA